MSSWNKKNYINQMKSTGRLLPVVERSLITETLRRNAKRDTLHLHPSEMSKKDWCPRSSWYKIKGYPMADEALSFQRLNIFAEGHAIHDKWQRWLREAGLLGGMWECLTCTNLFDADAPNVCTSCFGKDLKYREVPIRHDDLHIIGHADGRIKDDKGTALIEIKSVGLGTVRWENPTLYNGYQSKELTVDGVWRNIKKPFASHIRQGTIYMHCTGIDTMIYIYEWKPTQDVKEFVIEYQPEIMEPIIEGCQQVIDHLDDDVPPPRPKWASSLLGECKKCPFNKECWSE
jgi:hypothetical protein